MITHCTAAVQIQYFRSAELRYALKAERLSMRFHRATIFTDLSFSADTGSPLAITGPNGSGKSTLLGIIAGIQRPTSGTVSFLGDGAQAGRPPFAEIGFAGPRVFPYAELTAEEMIGFLAAGNRSISRSAADGLLDRFGLAAHRGKAIAHYSSGMLQRLRCVTAFVHNPPVILLDEPGINLDEAGKAFLFDYLGSIKNDRLIIIATNERDEADFCAGRIRLG